MCRSVDALRRLTILLVLAAFTPASRSAAAGTEGGRQTYDIASGEAAKTLAKFVRQSGEQVVFVVPKVRGVMTNAVKGEYTGREALERMLDRTALEVVEDEKTGALLVNRTGANGGKPTLTESPPRTRKTGKPKKMNSKRTNMIATMAAWLGFTMMQTAVPAIGVAQTTATAPQATGSISGRVQNIATGQYLNNARVSVRGSNNTVFTDKDGSYRLVNVPSGPVTLEVFFTDLDRAAIQVIVPPGGLLTQDVNLTSVARYGKKVDDIVQFDPYIVSQDRETDAQAIATNEQRFAANIKSVLSTDSLGDVLGGSVGEFMKFLPGVTVENDYSDVVGISIRGIGGGMTTITQDGAPASNIWVDTTRSVDLRSMALNDISRMEVTKIPTPANPADSLAGSVNLVGKSAFERSGRQLRFSLNLVANHENLDFKKTPHSHQDTMTYKILPGGNFDFTWPITKRFGIVIAATHSRVFNEQHRSTMTWGSLSPTGSPTGTPKDFTNPVLASFVLTDGPRDLTRKTISIKADWKVTPNSVLSFGHIASRTDTRIGTLTYQWDPSATPTSVTTSSALDKRPLTWDANNTYGATGRGRFISFPTNQFIQQISDSSKIGYRYDNGHWRVESGVSRSVSQTKARYADQGFFSRIDVVNLNPVRVNLIGIGQSSPSSIEVFDNNGNPVDWNDPANSKATTATTNERVHRSQTNQGFLNVRRTLDFMPVPTSIQAGVLEKRVMLDTDPISQAVTTFKGPDGLTPLASIEPYMMQNYKNVDPGFNVPSSIRWMSPSRAYSAYQLNPLLYQQTAAQMVTARNTEIANSQNIKEKVQAAYVQADVRLFRSRLRILGGVRFEKTIDKGIGALVDSELIWQRNPDGSFIIVGGKRVRKTEAGLAGSMEESLLIRKERGASSDRAYDGYYPSLHFTFNAAENLLLRAAWARTYGRPNFSDVIPNIDVVTTVNDPDDDLGRLNVRNPALMPWTSDNFDLSAEYYTNTGGMITAGIFLKEISDFFGAEVRVATPELLAELGLDERYVGWDINTKFNAGDARITGAEISFRQNLRVLGNWGKTVTLFANATKLDLDGNQGANFSSFVTKSGNWGFTFAPKRFTFTARWNYRGLDKRVARADATYGPNAYEYIAARTVLDVNGSYQLTKKLSLVASANNVFNTPVQVLRYGDGWASYARMYSQMEYGIQMAVGIRGTF